MYPVVRFLKEMLKFRGKPLGLHQTHISHHLCWPWDLDPWMELNNGSTLTLFDLGRIPLMARLGIVRATSDNGWGMTVAGSSVRYRRRIRMFQRFEMHSRLVGWDARFLYIVQTMQREGEALNQILVRMATTCDTGILPTATLVAALGQAETQSPALPDWIRAWIDAEASRPWPPERTDTAPGS